MVFLARVGAECSIWNSPSLVFLLKSDSLFSSQMATKENDTIFLTTPQQELRIKCLTGVDFFNSIYFSSAHLTSHLEAELGMNSVHIIEIYFD